MSAKPDLALLRFLCAAAGATIVLNEAPDGAGAHGSPRAPGNSLPERLVAAARALHAAASADEGATIAYGRLAALPAYAHLRAITAELAAFEPAALGHRAARLAFWINVYNVLAIDAAAQFGIAGSVRGQPGFFHRAAYRIGARRFSLHEIEHGVLRGNRAALPRLPAPFAPNDARLACCLRPPEPRLHFALHCATRSCPPLRVYTAAHVDAELEEATRAFVQGGGVTFAGETVRLSSIFAFYAEDFGGRTGLTTVIGPFLEGDERRRLHEALCAGREQYDPYDWTLNAAGARVTPLAGTSAG